MSGEYYDVESLRAAVVAGFVPRLHFFWGHRSKDGRIGDGCLSQWWPCRFTVDGERFTTAEQFMMAGKARLFGDEPMRAEIMKRVEPGEVKALGRRVQGFDEGRWKAARFELVVAGNRAKFAQDDALRNFLLSTRDEILVEASPMDTVWGIGYARDNPRAQSVSEWRGLNLLGFALMRVRAELRASV
jgi:ribA/ribD-fused uncharacterized protein